MEYKFEITYAIKVCKFGSYGSSSIFGAFFFHSVLENNASIKRVRSLGQWYIRIERDR